MWRVREKGDEYLPPCNYHNELIEGNVEAENVEITCGNGEGEWGNAGVDEQEGSGTENSLIDSDYQSEDECTDDDVAWQRNVDHDVVEVNVDDDVEDSGSEDIVEHDGDDFDERRVSDEESEHDIYPKFNKEVVFNPEFEVGMTFPNKELFKKAITSHAINTQRCLYFEKNDKIRIYAKCRGEDCRWFCHALKVKDEATFQIRNFNRIHKCAPTCHVTNMSSKWLSEKYLSNFQDDHPKRDIAGWRRGVMREINVDVSGQQAYRARTKALAIIEGVPDLQYRELWNYADELRKSNPGSTIVIDTESIDGEVRFSKMYMCFEAVKRGFRNGCRPFIGVDGCWLKGPRGGILLSAVGVDPGNALYPLAYAVVPKENKETWEWFLILLKNDLEILNQEDYTFMPDKQKGLILAFREVFPNSEHRFCVRHMQINFIRAGFRGGVYKDALWKAARASTVGMFNQRMREMREMNEAAANWFSDKHPGQWSKSHFNEKSKCDMLLNNGCESFNGTIKDARDKPILTMFEWIRLWLMERLQKNRDLANHKWKGRLPPKIKNILNKRTGTVGDCLVIKGSIRHYQIECGDGSLFSVDLELWKCSCRIWDLSGIPCKHALAAIMHQGGDPELFVHYYYSLETYRKVYEPALMPITGQVDWAETIYIPPLPPTLGRTIGRPQKARRMEPDEKRQKNSKVKMKRQQSTLRCTKCGNTGHNKKTCTEVSLNEEAPHAVNERRRKKIRVRRKNINMAASGSRVINLNEITQEEVMNTLTLVGSGSNMTVSGNLRSPSWSLFDEDDREFEAILNVANSGAYDWGMPAVPLAHGPTPWQQLKMSTGGDSRPMQTGPLIKDSTLGGLRPMFTTQPREETSSKHFFHQILH